MTYILQMRTWRDATGVAGDPEHASWEPQGSGCEPWRLGVIVTSKASSQTDLFTAKASFTHSSPHRHPAFKEKKG